ncbi:MAG: hypothetical protein ABIK83_13820 [Candidatus Zixiibacteriota bacterium]
MGDIRKYLRNLRKDNHQSEDQLREEIPEESVLGMDLQKFGRENLIVLVRSYLLNDDICLLSNRRCLQHVEGDYVTYLPDELEFVYRMSPESLKRVHLVKKHLGGIIRSLEITKEDSPR